METETHVYTAAPEGFSCETQVAGCYLEVEGRVLLLQRAGEKSEPGKWGVPAGKLEKGESVTEAAMRELFEETGIVVEGASKIQHLRALYVRKPHVEYVFHMFKIHLDQLPAVKLSDEHQDFRWVTEADVEAMPLVGGAKDALKLYRSRPVKVGSGTSVNAFLILKQEGKVLLHVRKNTGYCDGMWSLVAGHVEDGESATQGMVREAREEIGIRVQPEHLEVVHVMHRPSNRFNIDIFFACSTWEGEIRNCEPEKCGEIRFFGMEELPANTIEHLACVLRKIEAGLFYSEFGWPPA